MCIASSSDRKLIAAMAQQIVDLGEAYQDNERRADANYSALSNCERRLAGKRDNHADTQAALEQAQDTIKRQTHSFNAEVELRQLFEQVAEGLNALATNQAERITELEDRLTAWMDTAGRLTRERDELQAQNEQLTGYLREIIEAYDNDDYIATDAIDAMSPTIGLARQALAPDPGLEADVAF